MEELASWLSQRAQTKREIDRAQTVEGHRLSERQLFSFLDILPVGVFVTDASGMPCYLNREAHVLLGQGIVPGAGPADLAVAYRVYVAGTDTFYPHERMPLAGALRGERFHRDDMEVARPGGRVALEAWGVPLVGADGTLEYAVAVIVDISQRRRREREASVRAAQPDDARRAVHATAF
jgi:PAS domain-containing protein